MYQNLEDYLREIGHYLAVRDGVDDILSEIRSHILEKTEEEYDAVTEERVGKVISTYGRPQQIAAKYMEGVEIISPTFKRHLFLYTGILFLCHATMALFAFLTNISMLSFPFLYIPKMDGWQMIFYMPMAFVYDLGLVMIFLYFITQRKKEIRLPWPKFFSLHASRKDLRAPKVTFLIILILVFGSFLYLFFRYETIFFASMNDVAHPVPMFGPSASFYYSGLFLAMLWCEVVGYATRFITRSRWTELIKTAIILLLLQFVWNGPVEADFTNIPGLNIEQTMTTFLLIFTVLITFGFLKNLISVSQKQHTKKNI
jgi:hypothetical protein